MATERERLAMRANGTAFAILYAPRSIPDSARPRRKSRPKLSHTAKVLRDLDNSAPAFNCLLYTSPSPRD